MNDQIKLKKQRGFSVSEQRVTVTIEGEQYQCANLLKSGIINQNTILIAHDGIWNEVNVLNIGADNSNLNDFKSHCELYDYKLSDFGIKTEKSSKIMQYGLCHDDYMKIESKYSNFSYIKIGKLHKYLSESRPHVTYDDLISHIKQCDRLGKTIDQWVEELKEAKNNIINLNFKPMENTTINERIQQLIALGATESENNYLVAGIEITGDMIATLTEAGWNEIIAGIEMLKPKSEMIQELIDLNSEDRTQNRIGAIKELGLLNSETDFVGFGFTVTLKSIQEDTDDEFAELLAKIKDSESFKSSPIPAAPETTEIVCETETILAEPIEAKPIEQPEQPVKKPITLETFGKLTPERISELSGLKEKQELIVKENPIIKVTDAKTLKEAKKTAAVLLKASTAIDGTTGIEATATKYLNQFKNMIKNAVGPLAKITRDKYNEQKKIIDDYENAEALRIQKEQQEKLKKIKDRTDKLFAVPMTFNGTIYSIGELLITPSEIENSTDEDFEKLVLQAETIKKRIEDAEKAEQTKDDVIKNLAEQLSKATNEPVEQIIARMTGKPVTIVEPNTAPALAPVATSDAPVAPFEQQSPAAPSTISPETATETHAEPQAPQTAEKSQVQELATWIASTVYTMPEQDNKLMNKMDLENVAHLEKPAYIKCRSYYAKGLVDAALEIERILAEGGKKPEVIAFLEIIKKSK